MLIKKIEESFNKHLNAEIYSSYLYLSMSAYFESTNLKGLASWMKIQAQEEMVHAMKFYDYIIERGSKVKLTEINSPETTWESPEAVFKQVCEHERMVTGLINNLVDIAIQERDHASHFFLQWFVTEQVEEEVVLEEVLAKIKLAGNQTGSLYMFDKELGQRVFTAPAPPA
jgi:ferritin